MRLHFYFDVDAFYKRSEDLSETATNFYNNVKEQVNDPEKSNKQLPKLNNKRNNLSNFNFKRNIKK